MKKVLDKPINDVLTLMDSNSPVRKNLLKKLFVNSIDGMQFYDFLAKQSQIPIVGNLLKKILNLYYRYIHTNSIKLPLHDIEKVINCAEDIYITPCPCRLICDDHDCDVPLFTCMRINTFAKGESEWEKDEAKKNRRKLSKEEAIATMRNARNHGLIFSLESCIQPYQNNICACCSCCCLEMKFRYEYGLDVCHSGPYVPIVNKDVCKICTVCSDGCPVNAITFADNIPSIDLGKCLGCGLCSEICPTDAISMRIEPERIRKDSEPGPFRMFVIVSFIYLCLFPLYMAYRIFSENQQYKYDTARPRLSDYFKGP